MFLWLDFSITNRTWISSAVFAWRKRVTGTPRYTGTSVLLVRAVSLRLKAKSSAIADKPSDLVHAYVSYYAVNSCPLVNGCDLLAGFSDFYLYPFLLDAFALELSGSYLDIWCGQTRMAKLQSGEGRMMIDSVVWTQYINVTDTLTYRQPGRHSKCSAKNGDALRLTGIPKWSLGRR